MAYHHNTIRMLRLRKGDYVVRTVGQIRMPGAPIVCPVRHCFAAMSITRPPDERPTSKPQLADFHLQTLAFGFVRAVEMAMHGKENAHTEPAIRRQRDIDGRADKPFRKTVFGIHLAQRRMRAGGFLMDEAAFQPQIEVIENVTQLAVPLPGLPAFDILIAALERATPNPFRIHFQIRRKKPSVSRTQTPAPCVIARQMADAFLSGWQQHGCRKIECKRIALTHIERGGAQTNHLVAPTADMFG